MKLIRKNLKKIKRVFKKDESSNFFSNLIDNQIPLISLSFLGTTGLVKLFFGSKNKKETKLTSLIKTNKIAGFTHAALAAFMYFGRPKPDIDSILTLKENIVIKNIDDYDITNDKIVWSVKEIVNETYELKKSVKKNGTDNLTTVVLGINNDNEFFLYEENNDPVERALFKLKEFKWGWTIRYKKEEIKYDGEPPTFSYKNVTKPGKINVWDSSALFSALTSAFHLSIAYIYPKTYKKWISKKRNPVRWIEYFITSSIMMVNLASVSGVESRNDLISTIAMTSITNIFGMAIEEVGENKTFIKIIFMICGFIAFSVPWYMILDKYNNIFKSLDLSGALNDLPNNTAKTIKTIIPISLSVIFFFYFLFPAIQINQIISPKKYKRGELSFILASLISKISLNTSAWFLGNRPAFTAIQ